MGIAIYDMLTKDLMSPYVYLECFTRKSGPIPHRKRNNLPTMVLYLECL